MRVQYSRLAPSNISPNRFGNESKFRRILRNLKNYLVIKLLVNYTKGLHNKVKNLIAKNLVTILKLGMNIKCIFRKVNLSSSS